MTRLVIDIGNSTIAYAYSSGGELINPQRISTENVQRVDDLSSLFSDDIGEVVVCAGVDRVKDIVDVITDQYSIPVTYISGTNPCGASIQYDTPETLGADRVANTLAAARLFDHNVVIADCGTAINIDLVVDGVFRGGMIAPGIEISFHALAQNAPRLPHVPMDIPAHIIGTDTVTCIQSGVICGSAEMIMGVASTLRSEYADAQLVLTGGHGPLLAPLCGDNVVCDEWLTLRGLAFA